MAILLLSRYILLNKNTSQCINITRFINKNETENKIHFKVLNVSEYNRELKIVFGIQLLNNKKPINFASILKSSTPGSIFSRDEIVSLIDPFSLQQIKIPAKSLKCIHTQCFDLDVFSNYNDSKNTAKCTICYEYVEKENICIDEFFKGLLVSFPNEKFIEILKGGLSRVLKDPPTQLHDLSKISFKATLLDDINLISTVAFISMNLFPISSQFTVNVSENLIRQLSDDTRSFKLMLFLNVSSAQSDGLTLQPIKPLEVSSIASIGTLENGLVITVNGNVVKFVFYC